MLSSRSTSNAGQNKRMVADSGSAGEPPKKLKPGIETLRFHIYNFSERDEKRGQPIRTSNALAHGFQWYLKVYPRGDKRSSQVTENVSIYLHGTGDQHVHAKATLYCKTVRKSTGITDYFFSCGHGYRDFCTREKIVQDILDDDGTLTIDVDIQVCDDGVWYPKPLEQEKTLVRLHESSKHSDIEFVVGSRSFKLHTLVISERCHSLFELIEESGGSSLKIDNVDETPFGMLVEYLYTVRQPDFEDEEEAKKVLIAADRLGVTGLKLLAESTLVDKYLDASNAPALLIFADSYTCPLLQEAAMKEYAKNPKAVMENDRWGELEESPRLLAKLLTFTNILNKPTAGEESIDELDVTTLRRRLEDADLELDGTREMLVTRLLDHVASSSVSK